MSNFRNQMQGDGRDAMETLRALSGRGRGTPIEMENIRLDGGTQPRATLDKDLITEYAAAMTRGDEFPPVDVFYDGKEYWLADGYHRFHAAHRIGRKEIWADIRQGTQRDAILHSVGVNAAHGKRRSNWDKRRVVVTLLADAEWSQWSDREIARRCKVSHSFVSKVREELSGNGYQIEGKEVEPSVNGLQMDTAEETGSAPESPGETQPVSEERRKKLHYYLSYPAEQIVRILGTGPWPIGRDDLTAMLEIETDGKQRKIVLDFLREQLAAPAPAAEETEYDGPYSHILNLTHTHEIVDAVKDRFRDDNAFAVRELPRIIQGERDSRNRWHIVDTLTNMLANYQTAQKAAVTPETVEKARQNVQRQQQEGTRKVQRGGTTYEQQTGSQARRESSRGRTTYGQMPGEGKQASEITLTVRDEDDARAVANRLFELLAEDSAGTYTVTITRR